MDKNSLLYWFPKIKNLEIPIPRTEIIRLNDNEKKEYYEGEGDFFNLDRIEREVRHLIESKFSLPVFLRTDELSAKHSWKDTCYLNNFSELKNHLAELVIHNKLADFLGLPLEAIVVREFIPMDTGFNAFSGEMPVNPERRYFVEDGKLLCHHAYWIEKAVEKGTLSTLLPENWKAIVSKMNYEGEEVNLLTQYSKKVSQNVYGYWGVDFCKAKDGRWILIDMALGNDSWHPFDCPNSNMPPEEHEEEKDTDFTSLFKEKD
ncbi:MAG: ATP-grasp domain-containing protein [Nanoarchaeota archaeon]|nr:ATP-grasp domain-containing protein [Nanoarchaeota archaeon]MBU1027561.1 ATP-grasp domain-containing protein [Nanoarchaeota archaeon]